MKKIINYLFLVAIIASFTGCTGMPGYSSPEYPSIMGGTLPEIMLVGINDGQQNEIIGLWKAKNIQNTTHVKITFDENGYMQEDIYSNLTGEILTSIEGQYSVQNNKLEISIVNGDVYQFEYLLMHGRLRLKLISN